MGYSLQKILLPLLALLLLLFFLPAILFRFAAAVIRQNEQCFQPGQTPPAITASESPEALGHAAIKAFQAGIAGNGQTLSIVFKGDRLWRGIFDQRREGATPAVVDADQVEDQLRIVGFLNLQLQAFADAASDLNFDEVEVSTLQ